MKKTYSELILLPTFEERYEYLKLDGHVGEDTFGFDRYLNQAFYRSTEWKRIRREIIVRDNGCDLAHPDREIVGPIYIHHINPISMKDLTDQTDYLRDPENLVCVSCNTHQAIHYGSTELLTPTELVERRPNDTCPWKG